MPKGKQKTYSVTPKGIGWLALDKANIKISVDDPNFHSFWNNFMHLLTQHGYTLPDIPDPAVIDLNDDNFGTILNCAVRYALGRRTYMPSLVIGFIAPLLPKLSSKTLWCFDQDVTNARYEGGYGDPCDENDWLRFLEAVRAERTRRGEELYKSFREV
jgi:hypothetical protein